MVNLVISNWWLRGVDWVAGLGVALYVGLGLDGMGVFEFKVLKVFKVLKFMGVCFLSMLIYRVRRRFLSPIGVIFLGVFLGLRRCDEYVGGWVSGYFVGFVGEWDYLGWPIYGGHFLWPVRGKWLTLLGILNGIYGGFMVGC